jgi:hypothetical protein
MIRLRGKGSISKGNTRLKVGIFCSIFYLDRLIKESLRILRKYTIVVGIAFLQDQHDG